jgi:hypothetical protein
LGRWFPMRGPVLRSPTGAGFRGAGARRVLAGFGSGGDTCTLPYSSLRGPAGNHCFGKAVIPLEAHLRRKGEDAGFARSGGGFWGVEGKRRLNDDIRRANGESNPKDRMGECWKRGRMGGGRGAVMVLGGMAAVLFFCRRGFEDSPVEATGQDEAQWGGFGAEGVGGARGTGG